MSNETRRQRLRQVTALAAALVIGSLSGCATHDTKPQTAVSHAQPEVSPLPSTQEQVLAGLPARLEGDGITISVGESSAPHSVKIYEDPRCPFCAKFEQAAGGQLANLASEGKIRIEYVITSFLDGRLGGHGSGLSASALRASVDAGRFPVFHALLFANQPHEGVDGFTDSFLRELAKAAGINSASFNSGLATGKYRGWVKESQALYESQASSTPTLVIDGKPVPVDSAHNMYEPSGVAAALRRSGIM